MWCPMSELWSNISFRIYGGKAMICSWDCECPGILNQTSAAPVSRNRVRRVLYQALSLEKPDFVPFPRTCWAVQLNWTAQPATCARCRRRQSRDFHYPSLLAPRKVLHRFEDGTKHKAIVGAVVSELPRDLSRKSCLILTLVGALLVANYLPKCKSLND